MPVIYMPIYTIHQNIFAVVSNGLFHFLLVYTPPADNEPCISRGSGLKSSFCPGDQMTWTDSNSSHISVI